MTIRDLAASRRLQTAMALPALPHWAEAEVAHALEDGHFRLSDGRQARQAASCLLSPGAGDTVMLLDTASGLFVTAVLLRNAPSDRPARLTIPGAQTLAFEQERIELTAHHKLGLHCLADVELSSATGSVSIHAQHLFATVAETIVHSARHLVTQVEHCLLQASALLRLHGAQSLITAKGDMKLDAERISLG